MATARVHVASLTTLGRARTANDCLRPILRLRRRPHPPRGGRGPRGVVATAPDAAHACGPRSAYKWRAKMIFVRPARKRVNLPNRYRLLGGSFNRGGRLPGSPTPPKGETRRASAPRRERGRAASSRVFATLRSAKERDVLHDAGCFHNRLSDTTNESRHPVPGPTAARACFRTSPAASHRCSLSLSARRAS